MSDQLFEPTMKYTERDMLNLLLARYNTERRGTIADRYVRAEHVRSTQNLGRFCSVADFIAVDKYASKQALIGHEVKVSRSDWLTELRDPTKSERIKRYCDYWYLVVSDASIVKPDELPEGWGLMVKSGDRLRIKHHAPKLTPEPLTLDFVAGLASAAQRTAFREPLYRSSRTIQLWREKHQDVISVCQSCGQPAPCKYHQETTK
ncbi:hypothetical protein NMP99_02950 [Glutamicibacter mishrai]|uniref:hypothetical protein n=1 Tax=Glutamicibacter mishrai TaxID=1775880 RepID=UPI0020CD7B9E|nr:hypothetical protein [Glutamicibacter mishrai]UTT40233.1 hypothetical protein NMP99_02660 [Glutamicibacter mishrai]UTT40284.1 hypothetical protein NMP99_02950 [Glutamicibacter mishrai]